MEIINSQYEIRKRGGQDYKYDPVTKLLFNPSTKKWVQNPSDRKKIIISSKTYLSQPDINNALLTICKNDYEAQAVKVSLKELARKHCQGMLIKLNRHDYYQDDQQEYAWCHHDLYRSIIGDGKYKPIFEQLVKTRILDSEIIIKGMVRYSLYRFTDDKHLTGCRLEHVTYSRLDAKIENYFRRKRNAIPADHDIKSHIAYHFPIIDLNYDQFMQLWLFRYYKKYRPEHPRDAISLDEYMVHARYAWNLIVEWNESDEYEKYDSIHSCNFGRRLHHIFTYLPKEIRAYIKDKSGNPLSFICFDLVNSQPAIFANYLVTERGLNPEVHDFIRQVQEQQLYEDLMARLGISRPQAKALIMNFLYCPAFSRKQAEFERLYGEPARIALELKSKELDDNGEYMLKKDRHKYFARMMQRAESYMFRKVWRKLLDAGYVFFPVHDSVYIAGIDCQWKQDKIQEMITASLKETIKIRFSIKPEKAKK